MSDMDSDIIARRELRSEGRTYEIRIERPRPVGAVGDYVCTWSLVDDTGAVLVSNDMHGVDAVQALVFAIAIIGDRIDGELSAPTWLGFPGNGMPRHVDVRNQPGIISIFSSGYHL